MKQLVVVLGAVFVTVWAGPNDLLIGHCDPGMTSGVQINIAENPFYDSVTLEDWRFYTPSVDHLRDYGGVYVWTNYRPANGVDLGDNLADYVDAGGTVTFSEFCWTSGWGVFGRVMSDADYMPLTHAGIGAYTYADLGDCDEAHPFMEGVSSITGLYYWTFVSKEAPATWVADNTRGTVLCAVNVDYNCAGVNMYPGDFNRWSGDGWTLYNNVIRSMMEGEVEDLESPYVEDLDPGDGDTDVPLNYPVVFHCKDDLSRVLTHTIDFTVRDDTLGGGRFVGTGAALSSTASPARTLSGELVVDDGDPLDVVCTWTGNDPFYPGEIITCTVSGELSDRRGNRMGGDFGWSFETSSGAGVEETTWGAIKAGF
jgi:hypothetical protein